MERVRSVVAAGADLVDIGGVKAGPGEVVDERRSCAAPCRSWPPSAPSSPTW